MKKLVLIGAGNVNWHLGHALQNRFEILQVYSRTRKSAQALAKSLCCKSTTRLDKINREAEIILIAVKDDALKQVTTKLKYLSSPTRLFLHTSGSTSVDILEKYFPMCGVLWPPQSIRKENKINLKKAPFVVVANSDSLDKVEKVAKGISKHLYILSDTQKSQLHLAAVMANNFTTHLFSLAYQQCAKNDISFDLLIPIIKETTDRIHDADPGLLQTGPAIRGDEETINRHLNIISNDKVLKKLYKLLSHSINPKLK